MYIPLINEKLCLVCLDYNTDYCKNCVFGWFPELLERLQIGL